MNGIVKEAVSSRSCLQVKSRNLSSCDVLARERLLVFVGCIRVKFNLLDIKLCKQVLPHRFKIYSSVRKVSARLEGLIKSCPSFHVNALRGNVAFVINIPVEKFF